MEQKERIDDLQYKGLKLIQDTSGFCFGIDAVLLSDFAKNIKSNSIVVDLCTGNGILPVLLSGKTDALKIYGIEIQEESAKLAERNVILNHLEDKVEIINRDLNDLKTCIKSGSIDYITVNPPYKKRGSGLINENDKKMIARHEISCTLEDIIEESARILKSGGTFFMIHKPERLVDILSLMRNKKVEPKRLKFIHPTYNTAPNLVLVEGVRSGKSFLNVEMPLYVYEKDGSYTSQIKEIYNIKQ